jgi:2,3-bisphosphoglycerate-dependent phosphoglycerate mutase
VTEIYLVRHAHSTYSPDEYGRGLSERGKADAKRVTECMKNENIDVILSSPYKRAIETVQGVADHIGQPVHLVEGLKERTIAGQPVEDFRGAIEKLWADPAFSFPGGESNEVAQARGIESLKTILNEYENKKVVIGTHGNIMVLILNHFNSSYDREFWNQLSMPDVYQLTFEKERLVNVRHVLKRM